MIKTCTHKLDVDDQESDAQEMAAKIKAALEKPQTPKLENLPEQIGSEIASAFYPVTSIFHADLRSQIIKVIESYYLDRAMVGKVKCRIKQRMHVRRRSAG